MRTLPAVLRARREEEKSAARTLRGGGAVEREGRAVRLAARSVLGDCICGAVWGGERVSFASARRRLVNFGDAGVCSSEGRASFGASVSLVWRCVCVVHMRVLLGESRRGALCIRGGVACVLEVSRSDQAAVAAERCVGGDVQRRCLRQELGGAEPPVLLRWSAWTAPRGVWRRIGEPWCENGAVVRERPHRSTVRVSGLVLQRRRGVFPLFVVPLGCCLRHALNE